MSRQIIHYKSMISWSPQTIVISFLFIACQSKSENNLRDHQTSVDIPIKDSLNRPNDMAVSALDMTISALDMSDDSLTRPNDMTVSALDMTISSLDMTTSALDMSRDIDGSMALDSGSPDGPPDAACTPSDEVCDGLDNNCNGEIDEDNVCLCERNMDPLFYICMVAVDWQQARMACAAAGDGLAVIETALQNLLALTLIGESPAPPSAWIGLNDIETEDTFVWYDMNPAQYRSWRFDMPDNSGEEDCVELQPGGWNDLSCDSPRPFICRDTGQN